MSTPRTQQLRLENDQLRQRIAHLQAQQANNNLQTEIDRFVNESKRNLTDMSQKIAAEQNKQNGLLHTMTANYEAVLKNQIELLNENKKLTEQKDHQDKEFNGAVEKLTAEYEGQIKEFEKKVKANVKRIQDLSNGGNMIARLLGNTRFRQVMQ